MIPSYRLSFLLGRDGGSVRRVFYCYALPAESFPILIVQSDTGAEYTADYAIRSLGVVSPICGNVTGISTGRGGFLVTSSVAPTTSVMIHSSILIRDLLYVLRRGY